MSDREHDAASPDEFPALSGDDPAADTVAGRYLLTERRGTNTDVAVFEGIDLLLDEPVAVRVVSPALCRDGDLAERAETVLARLAALPQHPNLPHVVEVGITEWRGARVLFVAGELLLGGSLRDMLDRGRTLSLSQAVLVGLQACAALDVVHRAGIVHGALRPSNILFGADGRVRVGDVGLTASVTAERVARGEGLTLEAARYASPEQAAGVAPDDKSDVYALAICLLEAVTGEVPFVGESVAATLANRIDRLLPVSADLGPLAAILERSARPSPADRWSVGEFGRALVQAAERLPRPEPLPLAGATLADASARASGATVSGDGFVDFDQVAGSADTRDIPRPAGRDGGEPGAWTDLDAAPLAAGSDGSGPDEGVEAVAPTAVPADAEPGVPFGAGAPAGSGAWWRRGRVVGAVGALAVVLVVLGVLVTRPDRHDVPLLVGLQQGEALNGVSGFDWEVEVVERFDDTAPLGEVLATDPAVGSSLVAGSTLVVTVSAGPAPRELPDITGLDVADAEDLLNDQRLVLQLVAEEADETVAAGTVLSWTVPDQPGLVAGDTVVPGTVVAVVVSAGPAPRVVPDLAGVDVAAAKAALDGLGLTMSQLPDEFSATVPEGAVVRTEPVAGTAVERGSVVAIVLSKGPDLVEIPPLANLSVEQARAELERVGLVLGEVKGDPTGIVVLSEANGQVLVAFAQLPRGTAVDITCLRPDAPPFG